MLTRRIERIAFANDASVYRLVPRAVVLPASVDEVRALFAVARAHGVPLTFRAAGTSLSGQAITDGILAVLSRHWGGTWVEDDGRRVRVEPGAVGGAVNERLRPFGAKIGPDPASIHSCCMGGILANNSSGMCCGVEQNAYRTLRSMVLVLPDGVVVDSARPDADERLEREAPGLAAGLRAIRARILERPALRERIAAKYRMKNTMGYSLHAFLDFERPVDILTHLMIGSEGTLGFIAQATLATVPDYPLKYTGLLFFPGVRDACAAIGALRDSGARALELMDRASLRAIADQPGVPPEIARLPERAAALLAEYQCATDDELDRAREGADRIVSALPLLRPPDFTRDAARQVALWRVRRGLIPSVGALRARGTSFLLEDVVFPVPRLADGVTDLQALLADYRYDDAIVFGHAKDGNLHFVLNQAFRGPADVARYDGFMRALVEVVVGRHDGALKAEHGTGRNMAPFVEAEWGAEAYAILRDIKRLFDPTGVLNPGVILNDDPRAHVTHIKDLPAVEAEVDSCIECGFCERMCPSRELTLTPRQRIVVRREMARGRDPELERDFRYAALDSCAADGLCALACPVGIDTGLLVKRLRAESHGPAAREIACALAERFSLVEGAARLALHAARLLPRQADLPRAARRPRAGRSCSGARAVLFPACVSRLLAADGTRPLAEIVANVAARGGFPLSVPEDAAGLCCGLAFSSKGYPEAATRAAERTIERLRAWSDGGRIPIVVDASPCAQALKAARPAGLAILDGVELAEMLVAAGLRPARRRRSVALHPVCSIERMGLRERLVAVVRTSADEVLVPATAGCCGFAGDRGFLVPELTASALRREAEELAAREHDAWISSSPTCEIGLARATGRPWRSFWTLFEESPRELR